MATFTSVTGGNWNDGATWGKTSPGVKGVDWPGNAGDVVNIGTTAGQAHVVTYNVSETNELGAITLGATSGTAQSRLEFATGMNTKLTLGHQEIGCQLTGELRVGASGALIPGNYYAELIWNTTADNAKGIYLYSGGKFTLGGDPAFYGSTPYGRLYQDWAAPASGASTVYVTGNVTAWFNAGYSYLYNDPELLIHKGAAYANINNDFCLVRITGAITYDGVKSTIPVTILNIPGGAATFKATGDVLNLSRNVRLSKLGALTTIGNQNTLRPRVSSASTYTSLTNNYNVYDAAFVGFFSGVNGPGCIGTGLVIRNAGYPINTAFTSDIEAIIFCGYIGVSAGNSNTIKGKITNCSNAALSGGYNINVDADIFGCAGSIGAYGYNFYGNVYSNQYGLNLSMDTIVTGQIGYDSDGNEKANACCFSFAGNYNLYATLLNVKINEPLNPLGRNTVSCHGRVKFEHYNRQQGSHYICDCYGDVWKTAADGTGDNPTQRSGGNADVLEVIPQSNCGAVSPAGADQYKTWLEILKVRIWAAAGVSKTYRFYVQTDFATLPTAELKLYGEYLDEVSRGHLATVSSTQGITTRSDASDWSQYVEVTVNPTQTGYVNLYLRLIGYEAAKKVWVDPKPEGVAMVPRWSYGEVALEPEIIVRPANDGLVPLGVKQVAI